MCRPLEFTDIDFGSGEYHTTSTYGRTPINNFKWIDVKCCLGEYWLDGKHTVEDFNKGPGVDMEFAFGDFPENSVDRNYGRI